MATSLSCAKILVLELEGGYLVSRLELLGCAGGRRRLRMLDAVTATVAGRTVVVAGGVLSRWVVVGKADAVFIVRITRALVEAAGYRDTGAGVYIKEVRVGARFSRV